MNIHGYKSFALDGTNKYGKIMPVGHYHRDGEIKFGINGNGYHFAKYIEDTLRYSTNGIRNCLVAQVIGSGTILEGEDEYNGYHDLYVASDIEIVKYLEREEIIDIALKLDQVKMKRFIRDFNLTNEEIALFEGKYFDVDLVIDYYDRHIKEAYQPEYITRKIAQIRKRER